jgi:hypothetical protein
MRRTAARLRHLFLGLACNGGAQQQRCLFVALHSVFKAVHEMRCRTGMLSPPSSCRRGPAWRSGTLQGVVRCSLAWHAQCPFCRRQPCARQADSAGMQRPRCACLCSGSQIPAAEMDMVRWPGRTHRYVQARPSAGRAVLGYPRASFVMCARASLSCAPAASCRGA